MPKYVHVPRSESLQVVMNGCERCGGFPQTVGAIDGTHIPVIKPLVSGPGDFNRKGHYSVIMQAVVDFRGKFVDANIGWPGKCMLQGHWLILLCTSRQELVISSLIGPVT